MSTMQAVGGEEWRSIRPLTERVLGGLGGSRWFWITLWSMVPLISPLLFSTAIRASGRTFEDREFVDLAATQVVLAYVCFVLLWGTGVLARDASALRDELGSPVSDIAPRDLFHWIGSSVGPLALTGIAVVIVSGSGWATYGPLPALAALLPLVVYMVPILTFTWVYLAILADLDRLGRRHIPLDSFPQDRTLGLEKVGSIASTGLGLLLAAAVPVLLAGSDEPVTFAISLAIVGASVAIFALSMLRLHRQMALAREGHISFARRIYAEAYAPVRERPTLESLVAQGSALSAAQSLDERAHDLSTWPIDDGTLRFVAVVVTGVITSIIVRALFAAVD